MSLGLWEYFWTESDWVAGNTLTADAGAFSLSGQTAVLKIGFTSNAGSFAESGQTGVLAIVLPAAAGAFTLAGQSATLTATSPFTLTADAATFTLTGFDANLIDGTARLVTGAGGGKARRRDYQRLDDDYWSVRERYIQRMQQIVEVSHAPTPVPQTAPPPPRSPQVRAPQPALLDITRLVALQDRAIREAQHATTRAELKLAGARIAETSLAIARLNSQYELEALAVLLASSL